jgi:hypothetical protein
MTREELRKRLVDELARYARLSYGEVAALGKPITQDYGTPGRDDFYQITVRVLQTWRSGSEDWIELTVSVYDGVPHGGLMSRLLHIATPEVASLIFHRDGRIETVL